MSHMFQEELNREEEINYSRQRRQSRQIMMKQIMTNSQATSGRSSEYDVMASDDLRQSINTTTTTTALSIVVSRARSSEKNNDEPQTSISQCGGHRPLRRVYNLKKTITATATMCQPVSPSNQAMFFKSTNNNHRNSRQVRPASAATIINQRRTMIISSSLVSLFCYSSLLLLLLVVAHSATLGHGAKLPDIYWNSSNPIFRIDNTDHIFDVNKKQHDHDQVDLVCPTPQQLSADQPTNRTTTTDVQQERYIIYSVSKEEYDTCRLTAGGGARVVAVCDHQQGKQARPPFTVTFRSFTPQPNGLEFKPGQDYYFISSLAGHAADPVKRMSPCRDLNMKVIFKVCCKSPMSGQVLTAAATAPTRRQQASTRRPLMMAIGQPTGAPAGAITLRPSMRPLEPTVAPAGAQVAGDQPITVLPIEVLVSTPEPGGSQSAASNSHQQDPVIGSDSDKNDIVQNDEFGPRPQPIRPAHLQPMAPQPQPPPPTPQRPAGPLIPFDPHAGPEQVGMRTRWTPTPLPPRWTNNQANVGQMRQPHRLTDAWQVAPNQPATTRQQPQQPQPPLPLPMHQPVMANPSPSMAPIGGLDAVQSPSQGLRGAGAQSRLNLYPSMWPNYEPPANQADLITVNNQPHQQSQAAGAPTLALALLVPLLILAILLALGLERRLR